MLAKVIAGVRTVITFHVYRDAKAAKDLQDSAPLWCLSRLLTFRESLSNTDQAQGPKAIRAAYARDPSPAPVDLEESDR